MVLKRIGITGGIGSGKTTVCQIFESMGIPIYYADVEAKKLLISNLQVKKNVQRVLGEDAYHKNGKVNKDYIGSVIFSDPGKLTEMNNIVHPAVQVDSERWFEVVKQQNPKPPYAIKEAALLVENGSFKHLDALIVVTCPEVIRISRVMTRDKISREKVLERIKNQLPEEAKVAVADYIINNDGNTPLIDQVMEIHHKILKMK
jgi:dephospho-CoA kinase